RSLRRALLRWYRRRRRDLPWRRTSDPYAVWVSEVMLQQTTAAVVARRWGEFLRRFPTVRALARAPEGDVLAAWAGLGYYARARSLRRAARWVVSAGAFPRTAEEWRALPGVGPYTAAAVASICYGEPAAVLDGNVARVLSRLGGLRLDPRSAAGSRRLGATAQSLLDPSAPGDSNQALMELGATVCTPRAPRCPACPLGRSCRARSLGTPEAFPPRRKREASRTIHLVAGVARRRGRIVLVEDDEIVRGHLIVPLFRVPAGRPPAKVLRSEWENAAGRQVGALEPLGKLRHSVMDRRYHVDVFAFEEKAASRKLRSQHAKAGRKGSIPSPRRIRLLRESELSRLGHGGLLVKLLQLLAGR
ncbi:MAG: A/G-specific adenine glycosylase, partial [Acidobacteriota bacterium]